MKSRPPRIYHHQHITKSIFLLFLISELACSDRMPCVFYFKEFNLIYDLNQYRQLKSADKILKNNYFYLNKTKQKILGEYVFNLCEDDLDILICPKVTGEQAGKNESESKSNFRLFIFDQFLRLYEGAFC